MRRASGGEIRVSMPVDSFFALTELNSYLHQDMVIQFKLLLMRGFFRTVCQSTREPMDPPMIFSGRTKPAGRA